jgi:hypothetical protein
MDTQQQVRSDSDAWLAMVDTLRGIETRKRTFGPGTPEFFALAKQVEDLVKIVFELSQRQTAASAAGIATGTGTDPIEQVESPRPIPRIIDEWREAERQLSLAVPDSQEFIAALTKAERLRAEYKAASRKLDGES